MTAAEITSVPMTEIEENTLVTLEAIIEAGLATFVEVGTALAEISDQRLYRATHDTFEAYVADRFGISRSSAYRKIEAARVVGVVSPTGDIPNERQARELAGLNDDDTRAAWERAIADTAGRPTAGAVRDAREHVRPTPRRSRLRAALPDQYSRSVWDLDKASRTLADLGRDDRFSTHRDKLARRHLALLTEIVGRVAAAANALEDESTMALDVAGMPVPSTGRASNSVRIEVVGNTAKVMDRERVVRDVLARLGVQSMRDRRDKRLTFPSRYADDVQAALEADRVRVDLERVQR